MIYHSSSERQQFVGEITGFDSARGLAEIAVKNKFAPGDRLELMTPAGNREFTLTRMEDKHGQPMPEAPGGGYQVWVALPEGQGEMGLLVKYL